MWTKAAPRAGRQPSTSVRSTDSVSREAGGIAQPAGRGRRRPSATPLIRVVVVRRPKKPSRKIYATRDALLSIGCAYLGLFCDSARRESGILSESRFRSSFLRCPLCGQPSRARANRSETGMCGRRRGCVGEHQHQSLSSSGRHILRKHQARPVCVPVGGR